ncbi:MAG: AsmA family protein [Flavobacteriales bacterium]|nr:AsmA family protein [Flavobacteriales bacterium]
MKKGKLIKRILLSVLLIPIILIGAFSVYAYFNQDEIIQGQIASLNEQYSGHISAGDTHLQLFSDFPMISFKVDDVQILENKEEDAPIIVKVEDIVASFNLMDILKGNYDIQSILLEEGEFNLVLHEDGSNNLTNAITSAEEDTTEASSPLAIHLKRIEMRELDIHKLDESTKTDVEAYIYTGVGSFQTAEGVINAHLDSNFLLNIVNDGDTTYVHHKHFDVHTDLSFDENTGMLVLEPSDIKMENGDFKIEGSVDTKNDVDVDIKISGAKPNFDLFIAFAPEDLIPTLARYDNAGDIYFNALIQGPTLHGQMPYIEADFGASDAFLENTAQKKKIDDLGFKAHFTNGEKRSLETMEFSLTEMTAILDRGSFKGDIEVKNFAAPEVDMKCLTDFNLDFIARFLNIKDVVTASGDVTLEMRFHDIIDLEHPERTVESINQAYYSEFKVSDFSLNSPDLPAPLERLDAHLIMNGKEAELDQFEMKMGGSDLLVSGYISDLPSIVHHTDIPVDVHLDIASNFLDLKELTSYSEENRTGFNEQIENLSLGLSFVASARDFTESAFVPKGEFFIDSLHAKLEHYPHEFHDFHADILVDDVDLSIVDFIGFVDDSDFHLNGDIYDYHFWLQDTLNGDVEMDVSLASDLLRLEDLFSYKGENFVPEDYRHEEVDGLELHVNSMMSYRDGDLKSIDVNLDQLDAKMHVHPLRFENFYGRIHYEDEHLLIEDFHGEMGRTAFDVTMDYFLGEDSVIRKRDNYLDLKANYIDYDELSNFNLPQSEEELSSDAHEEHVEAFNIYTLPFTNMEVNVDVEHFIYHRLDLQKVEAKLRTTPNHYLFVDTLHMGIAGGEMSMSGYFNGSDPDHIYLNPKFVTKDVNLDQLLFTFENFGQDYILSENLKGRLSSTLTGKILVYPDMVPNLDDSEVHMDVEVLDGRLINYEPMHMMADYMGNKDLNNVRFDTLQNHIDIADGWMTIPNMVIESTLGHIEISGNQHMNSEMEYFIRVPMKTVSDAAKSKLFKKDSGTKEEEDEIVEVDPNEKIRYINVKITGDADDYKIGLGKAKKKKKS